MPFKKKKKNAENYNKEIIYPNELDFFFKEVGETTPEVKKDLSDFIKEIERFKKDVFLKAEARKLFLDCQEKSASGDFVATYKTAIFYAEGVYIEQDVNLAKKILKLAIKLKQKEESQALEETKENLKPKPKRRSMDKLNGNEAFKSHTNFNNLPGFTQFMNKKENAQEKPSPRLYGTKLKKGASLPNFEVEKKKQTVGTPRKIRTMSLFGH